MTGFSRQPTRGVGVCLAMVVVLLAADVSAAEQATLPLAPAEPGSSAPGKKGALTLRGLDGQVLRVRLEPGATRFEYALHIDETANGRVDRARLLVTGLTDESGAQVSPLRAVRGDGQPLQEGPVEPAGSVPVTLSADIPAPGTYGATLTLVQDGIIQSSARLVVSRPSPALNVDVEVTPVRGYTPLLGSLGEATLQFTLHEKEGRPVFLTAPVLARLVLKDGLSGDTGTQALADARFLDLKGQPLEAPFLLDRRTTLPLRLVLSGLPGPGRYEGTLRLGASEAPSVDTPFVLHLREHPLVAFFIIALGVGLSFFVRKYVAHERPRMVLQHRVLGMAKVMEELKGSPDLPARDRELVTAVARQVDSTLAGISSLPVNLRRIGSRLELLERKVACTQNWLRLRRAIDDMRPASLRAEPQAKLEQVESPLREPRTSAEELSTAEATLAGLPAELDAKMRQHLSERLALFREELDKAAADRTSELARELELRVKPSLDKAGELVSRDLRAAFRELDTARLAHTSLLADRLAANLETPAPDSLGQDEWVRLRTKVDFLLAPLRQTQPSPVDTAVAAYESALTLYLRTLGRALADKARANLRLMGKDVTEPRERWQRVLDAAESVPRRISERKLPEAVLALEAARTTFEEASTSGTALESPAMGPVSFSSPEEPEEPAMQPAETLPAWLFDGVQLFVPKLEGKPAADGLARLEKQLASMDLFILVLVLVVATLAGMKLLWMEAPAWGSMNDRLLAFLWGFGLHQAFHLGLASMFGRVANQEAPAVPGP